MTTKNTVSCNTDMKSQVDTWHCQMCDKDVPIKVRGFLVGRPSIFLVCRNCWKGQVLPLSSGYHPPFSPSITDNYKYKTGTSAVLHGTVDMYLGRVNLRPHTTLTKDEIQTRFIDKLTGVKDDLPRT